MTSPARPVLPAEHPPLIPMHDFRVDGWLVQPSCNLLVKGATAIRVRPQLIDVLTCLAMQPGKVMSKSQILAVVWSDRYVVASGVTRCVAELRQAFADDARHPRVIQTIPKRGYRLIAPVEPVAGPEAAPTPETRSPEPPPAVPQAGGSVAGGVYSQPTGTTVAGDPPSKRPAGGAGPRWLPQLRGLMLGAKAFLATGGVLHLLGHDIARKLQR